MVFNFIVSCSTLNENECLNADWKTIGFQDGYKGKVLGRGGYAPIPNPDKLTEMLIYGVGK